MVNSTLRPVTGHFDSYNVEYETSYYVNLLVNINEHTLKLKWANCECPRSKHLWSNLRLSKRFWAIAGVDVDRELGPSVPRIGTILSAVVRALLLQFITIPANWQLIFLSEMN